MQLDNDGDFEEEGLDDVLSMAMDNKMVMDDVMGVGVDEDVCCVEIKNETKAKEEFRER